MPRYLMVDNRHDCQRDDPAHHCGAYSQADSQICGEHFVLRAARLVDRGVEKDEERYVHDDCQCPYQCDADAFICSRELVAERVGNHSENKHEHVTRFITNIYPKLNLKNVFYLGPYA